MEKIRQFFFVTYLIVTLFLFPPNSRSQDAHIAEPDEASAKSYYAKIHVEATATKRAPFGEGPKSIEAAVYINGQKIGKTPYEDGLPPGTYLIEVRFGENTVSKELTVDSGEEHRVDAAFEIPLTVAELVELRKRRSDKRLKRQAALRAEYDAALSPWQEEDDRARAKRRPLLISGFVLLPAGVGLVIAGGAFAAAAKQEDERMHAQYDYWQDSSLQEEIDEHYDKMQSAKDTRDLNNGLGISFLVIGGASLVTSIVLFSVLPSRPEKPSPPTGLTLGNVRSLEVLPWADAESMGLSIGGKF